MKRRYVLKNKRRFFTVLFTSLLLIFISSFAFSVKGQPEQSYETIKIAKGDTLWEIARRYNKEGDIRKYIYELKKLNNFSGSQIFEGDEIKIPK